jgi:K+-sensing histidine kinase KdpD
MPTVTLELSKEAYERLYQVSRSRNWAGDPLNLDAHLSEFVEHFISYGGSVGPLSEIKAFVSTLLMDDDGMLFQHADRYRFYETIDRACDRVYSLLRFYSYALNEPCPLRPICEEALRFVKIDRPPVPQHQLQLQVSSEVPEMWKSHRGYLERAVHQELENALQSCPDGGEITLALTMDSPEVLHITLTHNGIGLSPERCAWLNRQVCLSTADGNRILGELTPLVQVRNLIHWQGGRAWLESLGESSGQTLHITLPKLA